MEWQLALLFIVGSLILLMATGLPVAVCFMLINVLGVFWFWGGEIGLEQLVMSIRVSVTKFSLLPIPLFILSVYDSVTIFALLPVPLFVLMG